VVTNPGCRPGAHAGGRRHPAEIEALVRESKTPQQRAAKPKKLAEHGGDRKTDRVDNRNLKLGGTLADYLTARIARDRPDVLEGEGERARSTVANQFTMLEHVPPDKHGEAQVSNGDLHPRNFSPYNWFASQVIEFDYSRE
jgi:hypothetical protein